ncbi:MAG: S8 family serine peptidase [Bdellovibrionaceae bacterium]|nr:S8 family serine peptidase [Pseudobdellovibrionaceae bacterium]
MLAATLQCSSAKHGCDRGVSRAQDAPLFFKKTGGFRMALHWQVLCLLFFSAGASASLPPPDWGQRQLGLPAAWQWHLGREDIVVAVIDTGMDSQHADLRDNLWTNPGETGLDAQGRDKSTNGIDDDGNGFVDDVHGWNFAAGNADIRDRHGHGTHVAGLIAGQRLGVAPKVKIMVLKYYDAKLSDRDHLRNTVAAIRYAVRMNARIINYSGGGLQASSREEEAIREAAARNILFVAAAGNERSNSDILPFYPADYGLPNILSVTAIDSRQRVLASSNYGSRSVDLAAPGENILSTLPGGAYGVMTGTSQATAFASGAAALLLSQEPELRNPAEVIRRLVRSGEAEKALKGKTKHGVRLNVHRALAQKGQPSSTASLEAARFLFK